MNTIERLDKIQSEYKQTLKEIKTIAQLNDWKTGYLGKNGELARILSSIGNLSLQEKKVVGQRANFLKKEIESLFLETLKKLQTSDYTKNIEKISDPTLPSISVLEGHTHPLYDTLYEISEIFVGLGFDIARGPEIETDYYNFEALNFPESHPAKEMQDTFYIKSSIVHTPHSVVDHKSLVADSLLLRTHTSPVQIRTMKGATPPFKFIAPGRVYRHEAIDASHSCVFHQVEGFCVDRETNLADLKDILEIFVCKFFEKNLSLRFRPSFFPFTEPSVEVDVLCLMCQGSGCSVCKNSGYLEMLGAGMIHPNVLKNCGHDPDIWQGYAFGLGVERFAMLKYGIDDMRLFYKNNIRFLKQF